MLGQQSPNAEYLARALDLLEASGEWSAARVASARLRAADAVVDHYAHRPAKRPGTSPPPEMRDHRDRLEAAAREMRRKAREYTGE